jgi:hypothetical protein
MREREKGLEAVRTLWRVFLVKHHLRAQGKEGREVSFG